MARDELAETRTALEKSIWQHPDAHEATAAPRNKKDEPIRARPSAINRLPTELLVDIIALSIGHPLYNDASRNQELAGVSPRWREVIINTPCFWTTIVVSRHCCSIPFIKIQLARSRGVALDVVVVEGGLDTKHRRKLDIVLSCANRWRSLKYYKDTTSFDIIVRAFKRLEFPLLRCIYLRNFDSGIAFLFSANTPALEHLAFDAFIGPHEVLPATWFTRLSTLALRAHGSGCQFLPVPIHTQSLTTFSLTSDSQSWSLQKDSIFCPVLQTLILRVRHPRAFLNAIVAPNLEDFKFDFSFLVRGYLYSGAFSGITRKFTRVTRLPVRGIYDYTEIEAAFPETFPNVREVEIDGCSYSRIFSPIAGSNKVVFDYWEKLETLVFNTPLYNSAPVVSWLTKRYELGKPKLRVKLSNSLIYREDLKGISIVCDTLQKYCTMELDNNSGSSYLMSSARTCLQTVTASFPDLAARTYARVDLI